MFEDRKRELMYADIFSGGITYSYKRFIKNKMNGIRKEHKEFDLFLKEIRTLIGDNYNEDYSDIVDFIESEKYVPSCREICDAFMDIFNMDLSPKQAFEYMQECHNLFSFMKNSEYRLDEGYEIFVRNSRGDNKPKKFIKIAFVPEKVLPKRDDGYWFYITFSSLVIEDHLNHIMRQNDTEIKIVNRQRKFEHALKLFEFERGKSFLRDLFESAVKQLTDKGVIKEIERYNHPNYEERIVRKYIFKDVVGFHKINN